MFTLDTFYQSGEWTALRQNIMAERVGADGAIVCAHCGKPIVKAYDCIGHHTIVLTDRNVNDYAISLNPGLIQLVHHVCHNRIHNKLGNVYQQVWLVYGAPLSGKTTYVRDIMEPGDLVIDIDSIWECVSGCPRYTKQNRIKGNVFSIREELLRQVQYRQGKWRNAYVIGGYPLVGERERLCNRLGAKEIFLDVSKEECLARLDAGGDRDISDWKDYIDDWFRLYNPPHSI